MTRRRLLLLGQKAWEEFGLDNGTQMAAAISYHTLFAVVPLAMFLVSLLGLLAGSVADDLQGRIEDEVTEYLQAGVGDVSFSLTQEGEQRITETYGADAVVAIEEELTGLSEDPAREGEREELATTLEEGEAATVASYELADADVAVTADNLVAETLRGVVNASAPLSIVSFLVLAYSASGVFWAVRRSLDFVWDVPAHRALVPGKIVDLLALLGLFGFVLLFSLSIAAVAALRAFAEVRGGWLNANEEGVLWSALSVVLPWCMMFLLSLLAYRFGPNVRNRWRDLWLGAALTATAWVALQYGYSVYLAHFASYDVVYGALGGVLLFMLFVNLASYAFLLGAEVAAEYPRVMSGRYDVATPAGSEPQSLRAMISNAVRSLFVSRKQ
jgi:membrane protein